MADSYVGDLVVLRGANFAPTDELACRFSIDPSASASSARESSAPVATPRSDLW